MSTLITKNLNLEKTLSNALFESMKDLSLDWDKVALEFLSKERAIEQIELFKKKVNEFNKDFNFKEKKLLEIGAGVGTLQIVAKNDFQIESYGIEPGDDEFSPFKNILQELFKENNLNSNTVKFAYAENIPFNDNTFDLIYSSNVLEHVKDPKKVLRESLRVLKPGGYLQFVIPNYFSFWEGHYGILWPCLINKSLARVYLKLIGKSTSYLETLQLINPFYLKNILSEYKNEINIIGWGDDIFKARLTTGNYSDWATLKKIRPIIELIKKIKIATLAGEILSLLQMYTPIVLTLEKK